MATKFEFSYENVRQINIKEMKSSSLCQLEPNFYEHFFEHLHAMEDRYRTLSAPGQNKTEAVMVGEEMQKVHSLLNSIYERRERKIIFLAQVEARGGKPDTKNLTVFEQDLYMGLVGLLRRMRSGLETAASITSAPGPAEELGAKQQIEPRKTGADGPNKSEMGPARTAATQPQPQPQPPQPIPALKAELKDGQNRGDEIVTVRILKDVEPFQDADARNYYLKKEDVITLPAGYAKVLVKRGAAKIIDNIF